METKVLNVEQVTAFVPPGGIEKRYRVTFTIGPHGPFTEEFTQAEFIPEKIRERQEAIARTLKGIAS
jgi:hypothetical protein